ncbi:MAG: bifunctional nuclease family protein [Bacteroidetes bacterium]|nr:bifunctional nuclease family protein [Bacteroidota bacterium]MCL5268060.1 bifunctional nuclease family protein [Bacteroidota bacterium]
MDKVMVDILGLSPSPSSPGAYALILKEVSGERRLPIIIGQFEAQAIALELEGIKPPRPLTHDLVKNVLDSLGTTLSDVVVSELREGTFFARLNVEGNSVNHEIDARPSDAIAIAIRFGVPIYVSETVMEEASTMPETEEGEQQIESQGEHPKKSREQTPAYTKESKMEQLQKELTDAVGREDYERAAKLRDEIRRLQLGD